mmetsp:Transcript_59916/g.177657  ORF Transcript_59916/g.177657 Transcript_59916/m.177657 type:complete len:279 (-) Transcript_59916:1429-2265(-)
MLDTCRGTRPSDAARSTRSFMSASTRSAYVASSSSSSSSSSFESSSSTESFEPSSFFVFVLLLLLAAGDGFDVNIFSTSSRSSSNPNSLARTMRHRAVYSKDRSLTGSTSINPSSTASLTASLKVQRGVPSLWRRGRDSGEDRGGVVKSPSQSSSAAAVAPPVPMGGAMRCNMYDHDTDNMPSTLCISSPLPNKSLMVLTIGSPPPTVTSLKYCADNFPRAHSARRTSRRNFRGPDRAVLFAVTTCTSESSQEGWSRPTRSSAVQSKITECATSSART